MPTLAVFVALFFPAATYPAPRLLAEAADLIKSPPASILDTRARAIYNAGHVPGAVWIDTQAWSRAFTAAPDATEWAKRLGDAGIDPTATVLVYGGDDVREAARIWWILRYWGCADVRLLNGGWTAWKSAGGTISTTDAKPRPTTVTVTPTPAVLATKDQLMAALNGTPPQLVDARSKAEYCGEQATAQRNGMMPGAIHLEWSELLDPMTKRFKAAEDLRTLLKDRKIDVVRPAVTYCQSGGRSAVVAFALEVMGGKQVRNYYRSWAEWGNDPNTPVVKPANK